MGRGEAPDVAQRAQPAVRDGEGPPSEIRQDARYPAPQADRDERLAEILDRVQGDVRGSVRDPTASAQAASAVQRHVRRWRRRLLVRPRRRPEVRSAGGRRHRQPDVLRGAAPPVPVRARGGRATRGTYDGVRRLRPSRSEEHTSELQSLTNLVCRLLLEKKKKNK